MEDGYEQQLDAEEEESEESEAEGGRRRKGVKVTTERLKGNKGRLNAVDVAYGGVKKVLGRKLYVARRHSSWPRRSS